MPTTPRHMSAMPAAFTSIQQTQPHARPRSYDPRVSLHPHEDNTLEEDRAFRLETMVSTLTQQMCEAKEVWSKMSNSLDSHLASIDKRMVEHNAQVQESLQQHTTSLMLFSRSGESIDLQELKEPLDRCLYLMQRIQENQDKATKLQDQFVEGVGFRDKMKSIVAECLRQSNGHAVRSEGSLHSNPVVACRSSKCTFDQEGDELHMVEQSSLTKLGQHFEDEKLTLSKIGSLPETIGSLRSHTGSLDSTDTFAKDLCRHHNSKKIRRSSFQSFRTGQTNSMGVPAGIGKKYARADKRALTEKGQIGTASRTSWIDEAMFKAQLQNQSACYRGFLQQVLRLHTWWHTLREPERTGVLPAIVQSTAFELLCVSVILFNAIFVAHAANWSMVHLSEADSMPAADWVENGLLAFYTFELCLRLWVHRMYFFINPDFGWNVFDFVLVLTSLIDYAMRIATDSVGENILVVRMVRFLKLARALRALRAIRFCKELLNLLASMQRSFVALFWSIVLVLMSLYIFAVIFLQALTDKLKDAKCLDEDCPEFEAVKENFGTMALTMLSLIMAITGGKEWSIHYDVVRLAGRFYSWCFLFFVFFVMFAMINIMGAIFVEKALEAAAPDKEGRILEQRRKNIENATSFRELCLKIVDSNKDTITWTEFKHAIGDEGVLMYLASIGLQVHNVRLFFDIVAGAGDREEISIDRFVEGCMQMTGTATAIDMQRQLYVTDLIHSDLKTIGHLLLTNLKHLKKSA